MHAPPSPAAAGGVVEDWRWIGGLRGAGIFRWPPGQLAESLLYLVQVLTGVEVRAERLPDPPTRSTASWHISHGSAFGDAGRRGLASRASRCARCRATSHCRASSVRRAQMFERFREASSCSSSYRAIVLRWRHCTHPARLVFVNCAISARRAQSKIGRRIGHALISAVGSRSRFNHLLSPSAHLCACLAGACGRWSETSQAKLFLAAKRRRPDGAKNPGRLTQVLTDRSGWRIVADSNDLPQALLVGRR